MEVISILFLLAISFIVSVALTPALTDVLYRYKHIFGKQIRDDTVTPVYNSLHKGKTGTPTMGGILIWGTTFLLSVFLWLIAKAGNGNFLEELNFLDRGETLLPLGALLFAALVGLADDIAGVLRLGSHGNGIQVRWKLLLYTLIAAGGSWWFFYKLEWDLLYVPFVGYFNVGVWYIPIFIFILVATAFSANETDGLDGLLGGTALVSFGALAVVSFMQGRYDLTAFLAVIMGCLLAFLWFNIYPARFFMGDTGSMALGITIGVVAMLTNTALFLPLFAFVFMVESASVLLQLFSRNVFGKKIFLSSPLHHHFEAEGWPEPKVVMRFWIISLVMAAIGLVLYVTSVNITS